VNPHILTKEDHSNGALKAVSSLGATKSVAPILALIYTNE